MKDKSYILAVDIGNTRIHFGIFKDNGELVSTSSLLSNSKEKIGDVIMNLIFASQIDLFNLKDCIFCSVAPSINQFLIDFCKTNSIKINSISTEKLEMNYEIDNPREVGGDLLVDLIAAKKDYSYPCAIVDMGTVTKVLLLNEKGNFSGCLFIGGLQTSFDVLSSKTELLPSLRFENKPACFLGKNTIDTMKNGVYYSTLFTIKGTIETLSKDFDLKTKILTGGYSHLFKDELNDFIYDKNLSLKGLINCYFGGQYYEL